MLDEIKKQSYAMICEFIEQAKLAPGDIVVVGCSSSEVAGEKIGSYSSPAVGEAIFSGLYPVLKENGLSLAAQCCEHLNRALIIEREVAEQKKFLIVNAVPQPKAGGAFASVTYQNLNDPVAVESILANAGIDIGGTLIGMHLLSVAVPVRLSVKTIGQANITCARSRPKFIGGSRTVYDENLM